MDYHIKKISSPSKTNESLCIAERTKLDKELERILEGKGVINL